MREAEVVDAFCAWLTRDGWTDIRREVDHIDVIAERDGLRLYAEAKGETKAIGLDVDTMYGQILRRMPIAEDTNARFAVVVPERALQAALRVGPRVREMLRVEVYSVDARHDVHRH